MSDSVPPEIERPPAPWRARLHEIIFESETPEGKTFDVLLISCILVSVVAVMLESVAGIRRHFGAELLWIEWIFTGLFTIEYILRLISVKRPLMYARSFFGIIDLLAILPTFVSLLLPGAQSLQVIRAFRLLRVFRIFKLSHFLGEAAVLHLALRRGLPKITVFLLTVGATVITVGTLMYLIEGEAHGFSSIPKSIYWAIVTMTTVGFGDITPQTSLGQAVASALMITGYGVIAVPTGIVTTEIVRASGFQRVRGEACPGCGREGHDSDAVFCKFCASKL